MRTTFTEIFRTNAWGNPESVSGPGSVEAQRAGFQQEIVAVLQRWGIGSIVDAPCGDFTWMPHVLAQHPLVYTGVDIVEALIDACRARHAAENRRFVCADMTHDDLPGADLILCRDGLVHLSFADARAALRNFQRSGSRYLLTTTFIDRPLNEDVPTGGWRPLNLLAAPFGFPAPLALVDECCLQYDGAYRDKRLGFWDLQALHI